MKLKTIIVDDEESARDVLFNLLQRFCPEVEIVDSCKSVIEAVRAIELHQPQVVFLDIEMPNYAGFELFNLVEKINFETIFVTAYEQYAIKAFEVSALDYILKPIEIDRLKSAVEKVRNQIEVKQQREKLSVLTETISQKKIQNIVLQCKGNQVVVPLENIIAFEAQESYCTVHTLDKRFIQSRNLKYFETLLDENSNFIRIHKSWLINRNHLLSYSKSELSIQLTGSISAKLSKYKKQEFEELLVF